jgi:pilus assembly protein Flp/PilA
MSPALTSVRLFIAVLRSCRGAAAVEYGLIAALIVIAMFAGLRNTGNAMITLWNYVAREVIANS